MSTANNLNCELVNDVYSWVADRRYTERKMVHRRYCVRFLNINIMSIINNYIMLVNILSILKPKISCITRHSVNIFFLP